MVTTYFETKVAKSREGGEVDLFRVVLKCFLEEQLSQELKDEHR